MSQYQQRSGVKSSDIPPSGPTTPPADSLELEIRNGKKLLILTERASSVFRVYCFLEVPKCTTRRSDESLIFISDLL